MEDINIPDSIPADTSFFSHPLFLVVSIAGLILFAVVLRMVFSNTKPEFVYDPQMD